MKNIWSSKVSTTIRDVTVAISEWIPLIFYVTSLIVIQILGREGRNLANRPRDDLVHYEPSDAN